VFGRVAAVVVASSLTSCGATGSAPKDPAGPVTVVPRLPDGPPLLTPGERMSYRVSLQGLELAAYDIGVGDFTDVAGHKAIVVQANAKTVGFVRAMVKVDDHFTSWIDVATGRSLRWYVDEYATDSDGKERTEADLAGRQGDMVPMTFHMNEDTPKPEPQKVSMPDVWDYSTFLVALRSWEGPPGTTVDAEVLRSRYLWHVQLRIHGKEKLVTELGELPALRFDGHTYKLDRKGEKYPNTDERDFSIWISDDDGRVPLRITARTDYGDMRMDIVEYQPGNGQRLRR
jgi:hypothetical protein